MARVELPGAANEDRPVNQPIDDAEFEAYIRRRSRLSRRYRELGREGPPRDLDDAVLSLAREAHTIHRAETHEIYIGWMAPVAFAATVVLVFSVVLQIVVHPQLVPHTAAAAEYRASNLPPAAAQTPVEGRATNVAIASPSAVTAREEAKTEMRQSTGPEARDTSSEIRALAVQKSATRIETTIAMPAAAPAAAVRPLAAGDATTAATTGANANDTQRDPKAWLAEIERLRRTGQTAAAEQQMTLFRKQFPDYFGAHYPPASDR
jgi:hypothetical protein